MALASLAHRLKGAKADNNTVAQRRKCLQTFLSDLSEKPSWLTLLDDATLDGDRPHWPDLARLAVQLVADAAKAAPKKQPATAAATAASPSLTGAVDALDTVLRLADARHGVHGVHMLKEGLPGPRGLLAALLDLASATQGHGAEAAGLLVRRVLLRRVLPVDAYARLLETRDACRLLSLCANRLQRGDGVGPGAEDDAAFVRWLLLAAPEALQEHVLASAASSQALEALFADLVGVIAFGPAGGSQAASSAAGPTSAAAAAALPCSAAAQARPSMAVVDAILTSLEAFWRGLLWLAPRYILVLARPMMPALAARLRDCARNEAYLLARCLRLVCLVRRHGHLDGRPLEPLPPSLFGALCTKLARGFTRLKRDGSVNWHSFVLLDLAAELLAVEAVDGNSANARQPPPSEEPPGSHSSRVTVWGLFQKHGEHADLSWLLPLAYTTVAHFGWSDAALGQPSLVLSHCISVAETNGGAVGLAAVRLIGALCEARAVAPLPAAGGHAGTPQRPVQGQDSQWKRAASAVLQQVREHKPSDSGRLCCLGVLRLLMMARRPHHLPLRADFQAVLLERPRPGQADVAAFNGLLAEFHRPGACRSETDKRWGKRRRMVRAAAAADVAGASRCVRT